MQPNFDPKLFESQNLPERKQSNTVSERAVRRTDRADEGTNRRKKFKVEEKKSKNKESKEKKPTKSELPSAFALAAKGSLKDATDKESQDSEGKGEGERDRKKDEEVLLDKPKPQNNQPKVVNPLTTKLEDVKDDSQLKAVDESAKVARAKLEELFKTLVGTITQMKLDGKNETTVLLKNPPLFANAKLTLTSFDTAKGEFNITFSELTAQAKQILDSEVAKQSLMQQLEQKGYMVHIFVATTEKETTIPTAVEAHPKQGQQRDTGEERQGREQRERQG